MSTPNDHGIVVLAAGGSSRLGRPKQLLVHRGKTLVRRAVGMALATSPCDAVIVLGAQAELVYAQVSDLAIRRVDYPDWQGGMGASLRAGLVALAPQCAGALIVLCDQPELEVTHLRALCDAWRAQPERAAASAYSGRLGVPAVLPRSWFADLEGIGAGGARDLLEMRREETTVIVNESLILDIDRPADLIHLA